MNLIRIVTGFLACLILTGCALNPPASNNASLDTNASRELIAQDFVNVLVQINQLPASSTTLSIPAARVGNDQFVAVLKEQLSLAGYAIRTGPASPGEQLVSHLVNHDQNSDNGSISTYTVSVGPVSVRRSYLGLGDGYVRPIAPMQVKGADASTLQVNDELFNAVKSPSSELRSDELMVEAEQAKRLIAQQQSAMPVASGEAWVNGSPGVSGQADTHKQSLLDIVAPTTNSLANLNSALLSGSRQVTLSELSQAPTRNFRELGQSNFADVFDSLVIVMEASLLFDNDSLRLGRVNKDRVRQFVSKFDLQSDVFSVIGCSNGATRLAIGQEGLALGRAERVKQELLYAGVPQENILEEGCWAGENYDEKMPRRGVVLSLKRRMG